MTYLARWPDYFHVAEGPGNRIMGYSESLPLLSHLNHYYLHNIMQCSLCFSYKYKQCA